MNLQRIWNSYQDVDCVQTWLGAEREWDEACPKSHYEDYSVPTDTIEEISIIKLGPYLWTCPNWDLYNSLEIESLILKVHQDINLKAEAGMVGHSVKSIC